MANKNITIRTEQDGVEFFTVETTGESGMSQSGLARLCGVTPSAINKLLKKSVETKSTSKWLESLRGVDVELLPDSSSYKNAVPIKADVCAQVIKYYAFSGNETAQYTLDKFTAIGVTAWIQRINGWQEKAQPVKPISGYINRIKVMANSISNLPDGHWCVFEESAKLLIHVQEVMGCPVDDADLLDGSIGTCWANYRKGKSWAKERVEYRYTFPGGHTVYPKAYQNCELFEFRRWLEHDYKANQLPGYLKRKYGALVKI